MAKYDSLRKTEKHEQIKAYREAHPELSLKEVGEVFELTAQAVWWICKNK